MVVFDEARWHRTNGVGMTHLEIMGMTVTEARLFMQKRERDRQISLGCKETECQSCKDTYWKNMQIAYALPDICPSCHLDGVKNLDKDYSENDERNFV